MAESKRAEQRGSGRRLADCEKRRIVELALRRASPLRSIAREHGICPNTLRRWVALYGEEAVHAEAAARTPMASAAFLPVTIARSARGSQPLASGGNAVEITLASGTALRIESAALDVRLICALIAELRR